MCNTRFIKEFSGAYHVIVIRRMSSYFELSRTKNMNRKSGRMKVKKLRNESVKLNFQKLRERLKDCQP